MNDPTSWKDRPVREDLGACLYSFVVIADTHVDLEDGPSSSPFPVNALTNKRTRYCVQDILRLSEQLGSLAPKFVLHLGDLIHPVPSMPSYADAARDYKQIVGRLNVPVYSIPGNHDVGDKPVDWAPAGVVRDDYLTQWERTFGKHFQSFDYDDCHFALINAEVINSGLALEAEQRAWLERDLAAHAGRRLFLCLHYPPYLTEPREIENYDNLAEPGRSWILDLLQRHEVEVLFAGHVHHFWYNRYVETDCYLLPSTSFTRQDFSEMFRVAPWAEAQDGRNDQGKVGYFLVFVFENGHVCHLRRTDGLLLGKGERLPVSPPRIATCHTREIGGTTLGFDLRHPWAETTEIAPSGALDDFHRKRMRNDYPVLALWDMGARNLRVPLHDFRDAPVRDRIGAMTHMGHRFIVISQGIPSAEDQRLLIDNQDLISRWEVVLAPHRMEDALPALRRVKDAVAFPIFLGHLRTKADIVKQGQPYFHRITYGFVPADRDEIARLARHADIGAIFSGFLFRVGRDESPWARITEVAELASGLGLGASVTVFMGDNNPARHQCDDLANANRMAEGLAAAACNPGREVFIDTFMDLDRGHSVRNGVIDRECNPRLGYRVTRNLHAVFNGLSAPLEGAGAGTFAGGAWVALREGAATHVLVMPSEPVREAALPAALLGNGTAGTARLIDLSTGGVGERPRSGETDGRVTVDLGEAAAVPLLLSF